MAQTVHTHDPSPESVRDTDRYQAEYVQNFVEKWDELIDWEARAKSEGGFFIELLRRLGKHKVLDSGGRVDRFKKRYGK